MYINVDLEMIFQRMLVRSNFTYILTFRARPRRELVIKVS